MRIGIITQPLIHNYGGILQNYALQRILCQLGHKPKTMDYVLSKHRKDRIKHTIKNLVHFERPNLWPLQRRQKFVKGFIHKHISTTFRVRKYEGVLIKLYRFQTIIAGSDQIWRPMYNIGTLNDMYFNFVGDLPVRKIVYGASFGTDEWEYSPELTSVCRTLAQKIDAVSVREKSGVEFCRQYFGIDAQWVLDPTLLLDKKDYEILCERVPRASQPYVAAYVLDGDDHLLSQIDGIGKSFNMPIRLFSADKDMTLTVEEWLAMFRDANYVITDSFHGTVFSIIFNKSFISIGNKSRGMVRFESLLGQFGMDDRLSSDISVEVLLQPISWDEINRQKKLLQDRSVRFLEDALK